MLSLVSKQQVADQVGLFLELLEVILVGAAEDLPVEIAEVVAGGVLAVLGELDREAVEGAAVNARDVSLDDRPRAERQPCKRASICGSRSCWAFRIAR